MSISSYFQVTFEDLPGWHSEPLSTIGPALFYSASKVLDEPQLEEWYSFYRSIIKLDFSAPDYEKYLRDAIQLHLMPHRRSCNTLMHFTGYYEPLLKGSLTPSSFYNTPLYAFSQDSTINTKIPRSEIVKGALANKGLELIWVNDPIAAFFLQIQGSGRVVLENGEILLLGYAGTNQHSYYPIGKSLIERKILSIEEVSLQSITKWLRDNPLYAEDLMSENQSYVFFKILSEKSPLGTQGVPLTSKHSLAVDPLHTPLGSLLWVNIPHPLNKDQKLQHLMIAQDTGGAIKGAFRGDYFWGFGQEAEQCAGYMNAHGEFFTFKPI